MSQFKLSVLRNDGLQKESRHDSPSQAIDQLEQTVAMRILKRYRLKILDDVKLYNECCWRHRQFLMTIELVIE